MRTLIYAMQSSGASLFTFFMGQQPDTVAIIDLYNMYLAPAFKSVRHNIILKCVVTSKFSLDDHIENFGPDKIILFIRNPYDNFVSLKSKPWSRGSGLMVDKFRILDDNFKNKDRFDHVITYEDFIFDREKVIDELKDVPGIQDFCKFERSVQTIYDFNKENCGWCRKGRKKYGTDKIHFRGPRINRKLVHKQISDEDKTLVQELCPTLCEFYS